ncbi:MAG: hypothetical protein ABR507_08925, partial [Actinomycetota bacterium]
IPAWGWISLGRLDMPTGSTGPALYIKSAWQDQSSPRFEAHFSRPSSNKKFRVELRGFEPLTF